MPSVRKMVRAILRLVLWEEVEEEEGEAWARHFTSSVGVLTTHVARPPTAPASQVVHRFGGGEEEGGMPDRRSVVRL